MKVPFVDLHSQYLSIKDEIDKAIQAVIQDSAYIGGRNNMYVRKFEEEWAEYLGAKYVVGCANGTDALEMALEAMGVGSGDEVIVPAMTWISTAEAVTRVGATPVIVDIDPIYYTIDIDEIRKAITNQTKAIIPVHLYGQAAEMDSIIELALQNNLLVIEDAAQAHGASYKGRKVGAMGQAAGFSFYPGKNLGAYGDAGAVVTNDLAIAEAVRDIANHGQRAKHTHVRLGRNSRLDGLQAAILSAKLPHLDAWINARRNIAYHYRQCIGNTSGIKVPVERDEGHIYHIYSLECDKRDELRDRLSKSGITTGVHYPHSLDELGLFNSRTNHKVCTTARAFARKQLSLPMYPELVLHNITQISILCQDW